MPALVQPTHLLAAALLFGLQFLIWMSYRHAQSADQSGGNKNSKAVTADTNTQPAV